MALMIEVKDGGHVYIGDRGGRHPNHIGGCSHLLKVSRDGSRIGMCAGYEGKHAIYEKVYGEWLKVNQHRVFYFR
jgi:hypothetical protein